MSDILSKAGHELLTVTIVGLLLGAGLPAVFSLGMRSLAIGRSVTPDGQELEGRATPLGMALAALCFAITVAAILFGIAVIIWGKKVLGGH